MHIRLTIALAYFYVRVALATWLRKWQPTTEAPMPAHPYALELERIYEECRIHGSPARLANRWLDTHIKAYKDGRPGVMYESWLRQLELLLNDERVADVIMTNRNLFVVTKPIVAWRQDRTKMGVYLGRSLIQIPRTGSIRLRIAESETVDYRYRVFCVESGRRDGNYSPSYSLTGYGFCFGNVGNKYICGTLESGRSIAEAVFTMLDGLGHINPQDWKRIVADFRAVAPDGTVEPAATNGGK